MGQISVDNTHRSRLGQIITGAVVVVLVAVWLAAIWLFLVAKLKPAAVPGPLGGCLATIGCADG
jgi:hypothetical protein